MKLKLIVAGSLLAALMAGPGFAADTKDIPTNPRDTPKAEDSMKSDPMKSDTMKSDNMKKSDDTMRSKPKAAQSEAMKRARADWKSAKEACTSQSGSAKEACMEDAKKDYEAAKADAKDGRKNSKTGTDTSADKVVRSGQDDEALKAKCATMSGDARETCMADGKKGRE